MNIVAKLNQSVEGRQRKIVLKGRPNVLKNKVDCHASNSNDDG